MIFLNGSVARQAALPGTPGVPARRPYALVTSRGRHGPAGCPGR